VGQLLPRYYRDVAWNPGYAPQLSGLSEEILGIIGQAVVRMKEVVGRLHEAGVPLHAGTDAAILNPFVAPGISLHEEFHHLVEAGLSVEDAWSAATQVAGQFFDDTALGLLQEGAPADLLLFRQDPTGDLAALETLEAVVARGRLYPKAVLDEALARHQAFFQRPLYHAVSTALWRRLARRRL
jgi:adenine deaminase